MQLTVRMASCPQLGSFDSTAIEMRIASEIELLIFLDSREGALAYPHSPCLLSLVDLLFDAACVVVL